MNWSTQANTAHGRNVGFQPGPGPHLSNISPEPGTPFTTVQRLECHELLLGKCLFGIGQYLDEQGAMLMLPSTQCHAESKMALRGSPGDDYSRICTATCPDSIFLCFGIVQVANLVEQGHTLVKVSSFPRSSNRYSCVVSLTGRSDPGSSQRYSFRWRGAPCEERTSSVGIRAPSNLDVGKAKSLRHLPSRFHPVSRCESNGCNPLSKALYGPRKSATFENTGSASTEFSSCLSVSLHHAPTGPP